MNAPTTISPPNSADCPPMMANAERWRAQCIQNFAELEVIIGDLLIALRASPKGSSKVRTGDLVGVAYGHLRELTSTSGVFGKQGEAISRTLSELAPWFEWRAHLTHGVLHLWRGKNGKWLLTLAHRPCGGNDPVRHYALPWSEAQELAKMLPETVDRLRGNAQSLANAVA